MWKSLPSLGSFTLRVKGEDGENPLWRKIPNTVPRTNDPDFITLDDEISFVQFRVCMPCGHALSPHSVTKYAKKELEKGKWRFFCPHVAADRKTVCNREWDYGTIKTYGGMTSDEKFNFEIKMSENCMNRSRSIVACPKCEMYGERIDVKDIRMACANCNFDFCWLCQRQWLTTSLKQCGNPDCSGEDPRFKVLRDCTRDTISTVPNVPKKRACPGCGMVIEHIEACKHMDCKCGTQFCFICLKVAPGRGNWQCGSYNQGCPLAPVQTSIVGAENV